MSKQYTILLLFICVSIAHSTMMFGKKSNCPVCSDSVTTYEIVSWGSYIYSWDSKYDLIYWPDTDSRWYWLCNSCGYAQNAYDFFRIDVEEKSILHEWLQKNWAPLPLDTSEITQYDTDSVYNQVQRVNKILDRDDEYWIWFNKVLINHYREIDSLRLAETVQNQLLLVEENTHVLSNDRKRELYLLGEYNRILGNNKMASEYLKASLFTSHDRIIKYSCYFSLIVLPIILLLIWIKVKKKYILKSILTVLLVFLSVVSIYYFDSRNWNNLESYYDDIIIDRIYLLNHGTK